MARPPFPFSALVGQDAMRAALLVNAVDPGIGGVLVRGHKGTGKSTAVRALARLLAPMPLVELPLNATEDRLVGTLHVEEALRTGARRFEPGLLAAAHRGLLYVDEVNLLEDHLVDLLLDVAASGVNRVERDGISTEHAAELQLVGTMNPEEGELRPQFLDRFGLCVSVRGLTRLEEREEVVRRRLSYERDPESFLRGWAQADFLLGMRIEAARARLASVELPDELLRLGVRLAAAAQTRGHRAEIAMIRTARALAALLDHAQVGEAELAEAARYSLPHRLAEGPLGSPEKASERVDELVDQLLCGAVSAEHQARPSPEGEEAGDELADADEALLLAESMQVPGGMAAGSILFVVEKKSPPSASSGRMKPSA